MSCFRYLLCNTSLSRIVWLLSLFSQTVALAACRPSKKGPGAGLQCTQYTYEPRLKSQPGRAFHGYNNKKTASRPWVASISFQVPFTTNTCGIYNKGVEA